MDRRHFELLFRETTFCRKLISEAWDGLSTKERIGLLLQYIGPFAAIPNELKEKALNDSNPVVRMLAVKGCYIPESEAPGFYAKLNNDPSPLVRAAIRESERYDPDNFISLGHLEQLGVIALSNSIYYKDFAEFISKGLQTQVLSEEDAAELVTEFVRNPNVMQSMKREPLDGMDWYTINENFFAIWDLTTCTPVKVHKVIAWEFPLKTGSNDSIPDRLLEFMSPDTLEVLAYRQHKPLLKNLAETPEKFDKKIHSAAKDGATAENRRKSYGNSEIAELREEFDEFCREVRKKLEIISEQISEAKKRRRGIFGSIFSRPSPNSDRLMPITHPSPSKTEKPGG